MFGHIENGDVTGRGAADSASAQKMGREQSGLSAPYPPEGEGVVPQDVTAWWNALSKEEQDKVIAEHADWIGNRDGVPAEASNRANIPLLDRELEDAQRAVDTIPTREQYRQDHPGLNGAQLTSRYDQMVQERNHRLDNAKAMKEALSGDQPRNTLCDWSSRRGASRGLL